MPLVYRIAKGSKLTFQEVDGNFRFLKDAIDATEALATSVGDSLTDAVTRISGLEGRVTAIESDNLDSRVTAIEEHNTSLDEQVSQISSDLSGLRSETIPDIDRRLGAVEETLPTMQTQMDLSTSDLSTLLTDTVPNIQGRLDGAESAISDMQTAIGDLQTKTGQILSSVYIECENVSLELGGSYEWNKSIDVARFLASYIQVNNISSGATLDVKIYSAADDSDEATWLLRYWGQYTSILTRDQSQAWMFKNLDANDNPSGNVKIRVQNIGIIPTDVSLVIKGESF